MDLIGDRSPGGLPSRVDTTLDRIGMCCEALILFDQRGGPTRLDMLRRLIPPVTLRMLTTQLRDLERDSVVHRKVLALVAPRVGHSHTPPGQTLSPILVAMAVAK